MPDRSACIALTERVEKAEGPDRELDKFCVMAVYPGIGEPAPHCIGDEPIFWRDPYYKRPVPPLTTSLDAVMALIAEKLPGWCRYVEEIRDGRWFGGLRPPDQVTSGYRGDVSAYAATGSLALLAAFLRALASTLPPEPARGDGEGPAQPSPGERT